MDRQRESLLFGWRSILLINKSTKCHSAFILFNIIPSALSPLCYQLGIKRFFFHSVNNQLLLSIGVQCVHEFQLKDQRSLKRGNDKNEYINTVRRGSKVKGILVKVISSRQIREEFEGVCN